MSAFQQKIYQLNEKLISIEPQQQRPNVEFSQFSQAIASITGRSQKIMKETENRCKAIELHIHEHLQYLLQIEIKEDQRIEAKEIQYEEEMEKIRNLEAEKQIQNEKALKKIQCEVEEGLEDSQAQYLLRYKNITKEIEKQMVVLKKIVENQKKSPHEALQTKLQKQYMSKLEKIRENEQKKTEKLKQIEKKLDKKLRDIQSRIGGKIAVQSKKSEQKYQKIRRLFALVIDF